jgi:sodium-coupled monocarboxylate transporter 8/12
MFGIADYAVFGLMLCVSSAIGLYFRFTGGRQKTADEYLMGNRSMSALPVAFSLMASFMSAITLLGVTRENYSFGTQFVAINLAYGFGTVFSAYAFLPVFFRYMICDHSYIGATQKRSQTQSDMQKLKPRH